MSGIDNFMDNTDYDIPELTIDTTHDGRHCSKSTTVRIAVNLAEIRLLLTSNAMRATHLKFEYLLRRIPKIYERSRRALLVLGRLLVQQ